ncbi:hypothetical protein H7J71_02850 [Mycolicibacterium peregrinum]|uniref:hypothetical protein n=1 Tax=Mycolicibacterium peregrinum TaxID=43304 RepID=UPI001055B6AD|nr:hypothetical protein [Mycolicibacterium peregrinum]MCV7200949.1 hypothetical protein [Mycolicibacterium peregrinum]
MFDNKRRFGVKVHAPPLGAIVGVGVEADAAILNLGRTVLALTLEQELPRSSARSSAQSASCDSARKRCSTIEHPQNEGEEPLVDTHMKAQAEMLADLLSTQEDLDPTRGRR